jgi:hypothetical protein
MPAQDDVVERTKRFSQLALAIEASLGLVTTAASTIPLSSASAPSTPVQRSLPDRPLRCVWCDSLDHRCADFSEILRSGHLHSNDQNHVVNAITDEEILHFFGRRGMKKVFERFLASYASHVANVTNITAECGFAEIRRNHSARLTTIGRNCVVSHQIVDADVAEKRRRGDTPGRNVRPDLMTIEPTMSQSRRFLNRIKLCRNPSSLSTAPLLFRRSHLVILLHQYRL